ncbi:MAG: Bax inhibitor-1/YccA family protein [Syntrophobacterales bacterium]
MTEPQILYQRERTTAAQGEFIRRVYNWMGLGLALTALVALYTASNHALLSYILGNSLISSWGSFLFMGLVGIILASVVNIFLHNETVYWVVTYAGILIFVGLTAYDTQTLKAMAQAGFADEEVERKSAVMGALRLYLDFINLFLMLLRVMGNRR